MPLLRRLPKRGFNSRFKNTYQAVNVESLNRFEANSTVGPAEMKEAGLIGSIMEPVKILGGGKIEKAMTVRAHRFSGSAKKLLESAGCVIVIADPGAGKQSKSKIASAASLPRDVATR
jgi:large subunit ribosomal protein L15